MTTISIVVPVYNEEQVLPEFHARLCATMNALPFEWEVIYVNDGSRDHSLEIVGQLRRRDDHVAALNLSRNFGKEIAMTAGLDHAGGDAVVIIDADLQDPPEVIPALVEAWRDGAEMVYAQRREREGDTWLKKTTARWFYRSMKRIARIDLPHDTGDFRLMSRRVVEAIRQLREQHRFMKGIFAWVGFDSRSVVYDRAARAAGSTKWNYWKLWNLAIEGFTSFTVVPLKIATYLGLAVGTIAGAYGVEMIVRTLLFGNAVAGYPSLMVVVLFLGSAQLVTLGVIGEYLGRMFNETKGRPLYIKDYYVGSRRSDEKRNAATPPRPTRAVVEPH